MVNEEEFELLEMVEEEEVDLELSNWEFVCPSDADSEESNKAQQCEEIDEEDENGDNGSGFSPLGDPIEAHDVHFDDYGYGDDYDEEDGDDRDNGFDDDDDGLYGLNDELVPWSVSDKFGGRQRMRKLGKRGFTKMFNSKRSPYLFVRPGVVRGKHGLGLKHSL